MKNWIVSKFIGIRCEKCIKYEIGDELYYIIIMRKKLMFISKLY